MLSLRNRVQHASLPHIFHKTPLAILADNLEQILKAQCKGPRPTPSVKYPLDNNKLPRSKRYRYPNATPPVRRKDMVRKDGYMSISRLLQHPSLRRYGFRELFDATRFDPERRFQIVYEPDSIGSLDAGAYGTYHSGSNGLGVTVDGAGEGGVSSSASGSIGISEGVDTGSTVPEMWWIRLRRGYYQEFDMRLKRITHPQEVNVAIHVTTPEAWEDIKRVGLTRQSFPYIQFHCGIPGAETLNLPDTTGWTSSPYSSALHEPMLASGFYTKEVLEKIKWVQRIERKQRMDQKWRKQELEAPDPTKAFSWPSFWSASSTAKSSPPSSSPSSSSPSPCQSTSSPPIPTPAPSPSPQPPPTHKVLIFLNFRDALRSGIKFYQSKQDKRVLLTPGDENGCIPPWLFRRVHKVQIARQRVLARPSGSSSEGVGGRGSASTWGEAKSLEVQGASATVTGVNEADSTARAASDSPEHSDQTKPNREQLRPTPAADTQPPHRSELVDVDVEVSREEIEFDRSVPPGKVEVTETVYEHEELAPIVEIEDEFETEKKDAEERVPRDEDEGWDEQNPRSEVAGRGSEGDKDGAVWKEVSEGQNVKEGDGEMGVHRDDGAGEVASRR
ncbi:hypothetical protein CC1G_06375 [Coprinopsis cinerea okayama7|uniref:Uncharacterized protein n=1 Tax=Coprinopsis cinerea (strain Okayama-7 / 130 / ATCC MYA-4618 / FGSC 9003) TaxID=240176 RepID=A8NTS2_COPC7|nr:hypothetical protein CC1G_06375 [Coprinopsis cinerea okayama7\|eukprot:XP_001836290.2 hypothetical protein CC1G_06375 [Coprinopsis cinerea okayama7\